MDVMMREFARYVADARRNGAFAQAIAATVRPGDVVCDLGTGFGLLALLAARAGAARVYALEQGPYLPLARAIAQDNGLDGRIVWVAGNSAAVVLPEPVDVIVSETLGQWALEEFTVEYLADAVRRFGKPGVRVIPQDLELAVTPVSAPELRAAWARDYGPGWADVEGFDLRRLRQAVFEAAAQPYLAIQANAASPLAGPVTLARFTLGRDASSRFEHLAEVCLDATEAEATCDGWLGLFRATLAPGVYLSTWPGERPTHWNNVLFPFTPPRTAPPDRHLRAKFAFRGSEGWSFTEA